MLACKVCSSTMRVRLRSTGNRSGAPLNGMPVHTKHVHGCSCCSGSMTTHCDGINDCTQARPFKDAMHPHVK